MFVIRFQPKIIRNRRLILITDYLKNMKEEVIRKLSDVNIDSNQEIINFIQEYPNLVLSEKDYLKERC